MPEYLTPVVAHQGGWDEVLLFGIPIVIAVILVRMLERRARKQRVDAEDEG